MALRLLYRERVHGLDGQAAALEAELQAFAKKHCRVAMPGTTHTRPAMLSSFGLWADAWARCIADDRRLLDSLRPLLDRNPLGSAAGYGTGLGLDRTLDHRITGLLQDSAQSNPLCAVPRPR